MSRGLETGGWTLRMLIFLLCFTGCPSGTVITDKSISAVLGMDVTLPCYYHIEADEKVAQVSWVKKETDGQNTDIAILNIEYGTIVFGAYSGRVKEKSPLDSEDGGIVLKNAVQADEGTYQCRVNTFPAGNFDAELQLKVLVPPLPTLSPGPTLTEGDGKTLAASCTAEGNPAPSLAWDTEVDGINQTQRYQHPRSASVTSDFYVVPSRRMNGKALSCVVSHPGFQQEKRITHVLDVRYLAGVSIQGYEESWFVGKEAATLKCICEGNPPAVYKWSRTNSSLPEGIKTGGDTLQFLRPLEAEDAGVYICQSTNDIASRQGMVTISISEYESRKMDFVSLSLGAIGVLTAILLVVLVITLLLVNRHHKRQTKRLSEKIEELSTLSREASRRRLNSTTASIDTRLQLEDGIPQRPGTRCDSLRDPSISSMMGDEPDRRSYSTLTTVRETETQTELLSTVPDEEGRESNKEEENNVEDKGHNQVDPDSMVIMENQPFIKQGMTHFVQENGTLKAKPSANGIYINGRGHLV